MLLWIANYFFVHFVSVVPHITDAVQEWVERVSKIPVDDTNQEPEVCIIEVRFNCNIVGCNAIDTFGVQQNDACVV